jgi:ribonuclease D
MSQVDPIATSLEDPITDDESLAALLGKLDADAHIAVDTEFLRERTYYPRLCLLQLAGRATLALIDPLAAVDLAPLHRFLADRSRTKVLHAAHQDLEIFAHATGLVPGPVFDTQLAASLLGYPPQIGFGDLVQKVLGVQLDKGHARTDWTRRPLSDAQLRYARDDVRFLLPLADVLAERLETTGRTQWFVEDARAAEDASRYLQHPSTAWERLKWVRSLSGERAATAKRIAAWREERAARLDRPRGWILSDAAIAELVERMPRVEADLEGLKELPPAVRHKCGAELAELIAAGIAARDAEPDREPGRLDAAQMALVRRLADELRRLAAHLEVSPEVLATQRELRGLVRGERALGVLTGWRRHVVGDALLALARSS